MAVQHLLGKVDWNVVVLIAGLEADPRVGHLDGVQPAGQGNLAPEQALKLVQKWRRLCRTRCSSQSRAGQNEPRLVGRTLEVNSHRLRDTALLLQCLAIGSRSVVRSLL